MTKDEALSLEQTLRLALEALETCNWFDDGEYGHAEYDHVSTNKAITAIKAALLSRSDGEAQTRSVVKDEPVAHSVVAGALFDFMGWLTSREKRLILSSVDEASPAVEAITEFAKKRNLSLKYAEVGYWMEFLSTPPQQEAKDEPVAWDGYNLDDMCEAFNRVIEEHFHRKHPFHDPVNNDAMTALRTLRGFIPYMKRHTTPPQQEAKDEPVGDNKVKQLVNQCTHRDIDGNWYVDGVQLVHATCDAIIKGTI